MGAPAVCCALVSLATCIAAHAFDGAYDPTFAYGGRNDVAVTSGGKDRAKAIHVLSDGKILLAGTCTLSQSDTICATRLNADGKGYDPSFGPGGVGYLNLRQFPGFPVITTELGGMVVLDDGRIVLAGDDRN